MVTLRRIVLASPGWPPGTVHNGVVSYVGNLRPMLPEQGFVPHVLAGLVASSVPDDELSDLEVLRGARALHTKMLDRLLYWVAGERSLSIRIAHDLMAALDCIQRSHGFALLEMEESFGVPEYVAPRLGVPVVVRLHGPYFLNGPADGVPPHAIFRRRVAAERRGIAAAAAVTAPSRDVLERVRRHYGLPLVGAEVIPNPGPMVATADCWSRAGCEPDLLLFVGRFDLHKGGDIAIDAFREVARDRPSVRLLFVGLDRGVADDRGRRFDLPGYLKERLPDAGVRSRVSVLGPQSPQAIAKLRRRAFATLVPSRYETFSMTVVEALAFGSPLVASDAGGIPEMVVDGVNGLTFHAGDPSHLAAKIRLLCDDPPLAAALGARARTDYEAQFTPAVVARAAAAFYRRVLEERSGERR